MWAKILHMKQEYCIITRKSLQKEFMEMSLDQIKELKEEGIETEMIPGLMKMKTKF